jgi:hypothetical protein
MIQYVADLLGVYSATMAEMIDAVRDCQCNSGGLDYHACMEVLEEMGLTCRYHKIGYLAHHLERVVHARPDTVTFVQIRAPRSVNGTTWCLVRESDGTYITIQQLRPPDVETGDEPDVLTETMGIAITVDAQPLADAITRRRLGGAALRN